MCQHHVPCPPADAVDREAAHVVVSHPEQGWSLLCNGTVLFDDNGVLLPSGQSIPPHRPAAPRAPIRRPGLSWPVATCPRQRRAGPRRTGAAFRARSSR
jgi:hypothetical protein